MRTPQIRECDIKIHKLSFPAPNSGPVFRRTILAEFLRDLSLSATPQSQESMSKFQDFVLQLPLPSLRDIPTPVARRRPRKRVRTPEEEETVSTHQEPLPELPHPSVSSSSLAHRGDQPVSTASHQHLSETPHLFTPVSHLSHQHNRPVNTAKERTQFDSWSNIDSLVCSLPSGSPVKDTSRRRPGATKSTLSSVNQPPRPPGRASHRDTRLSRHLDDSQVS